jgi:hypothetical protein
MRTDYDDHRGPAARLLELGRPALDKWPDYTAMGLGRSDLPELIRLVLDQRLLTEDAAEPEYYAPIHAWRALAQLEDPAALEPLVQALDRAEDSDWAGEELPVVLARFGPSAIPGLAGYLADAGKDTFARAAASAALVHIVKRDVAHRPTVVSLLADVVADPAAGDPTLIGLVIGHLLDLRAVEAADAIERAYAAGAVDLLVNGDWEDVQVELGLLPARVTPVNSPWNGLLARAGMSASPPGPAAPGGAPRGGSKKSRKKMARKSRRANRRR